MGAYYLETSPQKITEFNARIKVYYISNHRHIYSISPEQYLKYAPSKLLDAIKMRDQSIDLKAI